MKKFTKIAAQGDVLMRVVRQLPKSARRMEPVNGVHIVAHSETGHHHVVEASQANYFTSGDPLRAYLEVIAPSAEFRHLREYDTHQTLSIKAPAKGRYVEIIRQREITPDGWRQIMD